MPATDPAILVKTLLSTNWNAANTDAITPNFYDSETPAHGQARGNDSIKVYESRTRTRERVGGGYDNATYRAFVSVDVRVRNIPAGVKLSAHTQKVHEEIERIIKANEDNPDAYWNFLYLDVYDWAGQWKDEYRASLVVVAERIGGAVPT